MNVVFYQDQFNLYTDLYEGGLIQKEEYVDLLYTLDLEKSIIETAEDLKLKEELHELIESTISLFSAVSQ